MLRLDDETARGVKSWAVRALVRACKLRAVRLVRGKLLFDESDIAEAVRRASEPGPAPHVGAAVATAATA